MTRRSVAFEPGDVVVVPFPFTDRATAKRRPALVLSHASFTEDTGHVILTMITTAAGSSWASDVPLHDPGTAGLETSCYVRLKIFTLPASLIVRTLGVLARDDRDRVSAHLGEAIAL